MDNVYKWAVGNWIAFLAVGTLIMSQYMFPYLFEVVLVVTFANIEAGLFLIVRPFFGVEHSAAMKQAIGGLWIFASIGVVGFLIVFVPVAAAVLAAIVYSAIGMITVGAIQREQAACRRHGPLGGEHHRRLMQAAEHSLEKIR